MSDAVRVSKRPAWVSSLLAVAIGAFVVSEIGHESVVVPGLVIEVAGLAVFTVGLAAFRRQRPVIGGLVASIGAFAAVVGVAFVAASLVRPQALIDLLPGLLGVLLVGLALAPVRGHGSPWLLRFGVGLVFVAVLTSAVIQETTAAQQLLTGALCIVAWDLGENAISVGKQLGRRARTWSVELAHGTGTVAVAFVAIKIGGIASGVEGPDASLPVFVVLVASVLVLAAALHD